MRWVLAFVVSAAGLALAAAGVVLLREDGPEELLPDVDQAAPSDLAIVQVGDTYRLVFASVVDNVGRGPLLVEGERPDRDTPAMTVRQLVRRTDGTVRARSVPGEIRYIRAGEPAQWRLLGFASYELVPAAGGPLRPVEETGLCLGDRRDSNPRRRNEQEPERPVWTEECGRGEPGLLGVREGISPGYGDAYGAELEGQFVDVTAVPAGRYLLVHRTNPERALEESDFSNNAASVLVQLRRTTGLVPSVRVLARCPDSDRCPG